MPRYIKNVEQQRAREAYKFVEAAIEKFKTKPKHLKEYKSYIRSLPMMIKNNGINNAFAFVLSKAKDDNAYQLIDKQMVDWFKISERSFVQHLIKLDSLPYRKMTVETLAFLSWLKRFADGLIEDEKEKKDEEVTNAE